MNIGRNAALAAGFPDTVPGTTVDRQCGSAQQAVHFAAQAVMSGAEEIARRWGISRETMDRFALESHDRAARAIAEGRFEREIVPLATRRAKVVGKVAQAGTDLGDPDGEGPLTYDEGVRAGSAYAKLASLPPRSWKVAW
jgi:acetyl-CoA acyltransferase